MNVQYIHTIIYKVQGEIQRWIRATVSPPCMDRKFRQADNFKKIPDLPPQFLNLLSSEFFLWGNLKGQA